MLGLEKGVVRLVPYTPEWKQIFALEKSTLLAVLGSNALEIQHVGSTAIPGIVAKPIIDIAIAVKDYDESKTYLSLIEDLGYEYRGEFGIPLRHYFVKGDPRLFHIHMCEVTSTTWQNLILFRDYLCQHPKVAQEYALFKQQLASKFPQDREAYLKGKTVFVEQVLQRARKEV